MGRFLARLCAATVLGISLLASQAGQATASDLSTTAGQAASQPGPATARGGPRLPQAAQPGSAIVPGFDSTTYGPNDDGSYPCTSQVDGTPSGCTRPIPLPFTIDYYGTKYSSVYLNNNGNLTFGAPLSTYTPESLNQISVPMIAPFWADVDTRVGPLVTYGDGTIGGHIAFGVNCLNVGCFSRSTR